MSTEIWHATGFDGIFSRSKTEPLILTCECRRADDEYEERQLVVKSPGHPGVLDVNLFSELFGSLLAGEFRIKTTSPEIVAITQDFIDSIKYLLPSTVQLRPGYGVGFGYSPPLTPLISDFKIPPSLRSQATMIYAFDLLVSNPDRKRTNANCSLQNGELVAFDFEEAFSFIENQSGFRPWMVSRLGIGASHIFGQELKDAQPDWTPFISTLKLISEPKLDALAKDFPPSWLVHRDQVFDHLLEAQARSNQLHIELERSLRI